MAVGFSRVSAKGTFASQVIVNTFWYLGDAFSGSPQAVSDAINTAWASLILARYKSFLPTPYTFEVLAVQVFNADWSSALLNPGVYTYSVPGGIAGNTLGPAGCAIMRFGFSNTGAVPNSEGKYIRRGYLAVGPILESAVDEAGTLTLGGYGVAEQDFLDACGESLGSISGFGQTFCIRAGAALDDGSRAYAFVNATEFRSTYSFRRSRIPGN